MPNNSLDHDEEINESMPICCTLFLQKVRRLQSSSLFVQHNNDALIPINTIVSVLLLLALDISHTEIYKSDVRFTVLYHIYNISFLTCNGIITTIDIHHFLMIHADTIYGWINDIYSHVIEGSEYQILSSRVDLNDTR